MTSHPNRDPMAEHWHRELAEYEEKAALARQLGLVRPATPSQHGAEDTIAHLKQIPPAKAIEQAREWTGRDDIRTLDEAIAAVREALQQES